MKAKINKLSWLTILLILITSTSIAAQSVEEIATKAAKYYDSKDFKAAIASYEKIIAGGYESTKLYYNLGNAYFRNNEYAPAILYYEKALKLSPHNEDILFNLEVANSKLIDKVELVPELFYKRWWKSILNITDIDTLATLNIIFLAIGLILLTLYFVTVKTLQKKFGFFGGIFFIILFSLSIAVSAQRNHYNTEHHQGIIFAPTVNIKSSPDEKSKDIFVLHEGTKVTVLDALNDWHEIRIGNGSKGWIKATDYRLI